MTLTPWQHDILQAGQLYVVGGSVRDQMLGLAADSPDTDYLVRGIPPADLEAILGRHGAVNLVGRVFGVYKFTPAGETTIVDIAYPRKEISTGPGHTEFHIETDWRLAVEEDLGRRDFSINAIARNVADGSFIDPFGGALDLEQGTVRMLFPQAFMEDPLRILRGVRFATRFGFEIEPETFQAMKRSVELLAFLSTERIQEEMTKLLTQCKKPSRGFILMQRLGAMNIIMPEVESGAGVTQNEFHPDDVLTHGLKSCDAAPRDNLAVRWAALLHDVGKTFRKQSIADKKTGEQRIVFYQHEEKSAEIARGLLGRLKYSTALVSRVVHLVENHMFDYSPEWKDVTVRRFMRKVGEDHLEDQFLLREADCRSRDLDGEIDEMNQLRARIQNEIEARNAVTIKDLAIDGGDVMRELKLDSGVEVGRILDELLEAVLDDPGMNTREILIARLREMHT